MRQATPVRPVAAVLIVAVLSSCATTRLAPISTAGATFTPERDERRMWQQAREEEKKLLDEFEVYDDPLLVHYLEDVVARLNPPGMAANPEIDYRVTVLANPTLNAFAYPTGSLFIHTGLLARMENEDQLATALAHEMTHVENRHMIRLRRSARNKQIGFFTAAVVGAVILAGESGDEYRQGHYGKAARIEVLSDLLIGLGLQLALIAAVNGYGRDLEREADQGGFEKMARAGYDPREAEKVYAALLDDHGESAKLEGFFFGSHPQLTQRIESAREWSAQDSGVTADASLPPIDPGRFQRRIRPVIRDDARLNLEMGRLSLAHDELERARAMMPEDPDVHLLLGRLAEKRADGAEDDETAAQLLRDATAAFREAIRLDPNRPEPHLELGLLAYDREDWATACTEFGFFLELAPTSERAPRVRDYLLELDCD